MFRDSFFSALGDWQRGWAGNQELRLEKASAISEEAKLLPSEFRRATRPCYRKVFLTKHDIACVIINNGLEESISSWTTDLRMAKTWLGYEQPDKVLAAIFCTVPKESSVILNINTLWESPKFIASVGEYIQAAKKNSDALERFKSSQSEVILDSNLLADEIVGLTGMATDFDILCDLIELNDEDERTRIFLELQKQGIRVNEWDYIVNESCQRVLSNVRERWYGMLEDLSISL